MTNLTHQQARETIQQAYLPEDEREALRQHLAGCAECRAYAAMHIHLLRETPPATGRARPTPAQRDAILSAAGRRTFVNNPLRPLVSLAGLAALALVVLALLAVPPTRAALMSFFARVGAINIFIDETAPTVVPPTAEPSTPQLPAPEAREVGHSLALIDLGEPTTVAEANQRLGFAPRLPAALGEPDEVYLHRDVDLPAVTLVWRGADGKPLSLTQIGVAEFARKMVSEGGVQETTVNGAAAMWLPGPHTLLLFGDWQPNPIPITSNVLIWAGDGYTYRLEGDLTLEEAVAIAESVGQ